MLVTKCTCLSHFKLSGCSGILLKSLFIHSFLKTGLLSYLVKYRFILPTLAFFSCDLVCPKYYQVLFEQCARIKSKYKLSAEIYVYRYPLLAEA